MSEAQYSARPAIGGRPLLLLLIACACGPAALQGHVRRDVPWSPQASPAGCARAAAASLATYYGAPLSEEGRGLLAAEEISGRSVSAATLKRALESSGLTATVFSGTWDPGPEGVTDQLRMGRPLLVLLGGGIGHFVILAGFDAARDTVFVVDPLRGPLDIDRKAFERSWARARHLALLAVPPSLTAGGPR